MAWVSIPPPSSLLRLFEPTVSLRRLRRRSYSCLAVTKSVLIWRSILALAIVVPLTVHRVVVLSVIKRKASSTVERIRSVGFVQTGNLIAATIILALVSKL
jgi:hypothetical protein